MSLFVKNTTLIACCALLSAACGGAGSAPSTVESPSSVDGDTIAPGTLTTLSAPNAAPAGQDYHPEGKGWTLAWSDEFDGASLDRAKWEVEESCWGGGNNERQCYTDRPQNVEVINGLLRLKAYPETFTGIEFPQGWSGESRGGQVTQNYTSGKVRTRGLADWKYGRFSARIKLPKGQGTWPAFWMLPASNKYGGWASSGEIDIMEAVNQGALCPECDGDVGENRSSGALHFGAPWPENTYLTDKWTLQGGAQASDQYHVFAAEWGEGRINWFVDGVKLMTIDSDKWFSENADKETDPFAPFNENFYLMLNFAVGGGLSEDYNATIFEPASFPSEMLIDWVRVHICEFDGASARQCMDA